MRLNVMAAVHIKKSLVNKIIDRVRPGNDGKIPVQTHDAAEFHKSYSSFFRKHCGMAWDELPTSDQPLKLSTFLQQKFSTDPQGKVMRPHYTKRRKTLSWTGFYILDSELPEIVERVMTAWNIHEHQTCLKT